MSVYIKVNDPLEIGHILCILGIAGYDYDSRVNKVHQYIGINPKLRWINIRPLPYKQKGEARKHIDFTTEIKPVWDLLGDPLLIHEYLVGISNENDQNT